MVTVKRVEGGRVCRGDAAAGLVVSGVLQKLQKAAKAAKAAKQKEAEKLRAGSWAGLKSA